MAFVELNGTRIHYEVVGDAKLPVIVLSHSLGVNLAMWEPQVAALAPDYRVLRYDARGHGQSSIPVGPYTVDDLGRDVLGLLDALGIERTSFCGLSMGGAVGQWLGIHARQRLHKLVMANTAAKIGSAETWDARIAMVGARGLRPVIPGTLRRWFTPAFRKAHPEMIATTSAMLHGTKSKGYAWCCAAIRDADFRESAACIDCPTLIVAGSEDPVTSPADGRFLAESIAGARYVELPAAHLSNVEAADSFNEALIEFLQH
jgi:3-oxoadipate enol-lactonase